MTDTVSPITEPHLTPMFATGAQPVLAPNTEPHPAPIFDTGPHPDPLPTGAGLASPEADRAPAEADRVPAELAPTGNTGDLDLAVDALAPTSSPPIPQAFSELDNGDTDTFLRSVTGHLQPMVVPAHPVVVAGSYQFVKRWKFALIVAGVWVLAAAAGLGFYFWWYTALTKTIPVLGILLYLVACMVASLLVSMVPNRPQITALAIALMAAPPASVAAAALLHGAYYFEWIARPVVG